MVTYFQIRPTIEAVQWASGTPISTVQAFLDSQAPYNRHARTTEDTVEIFGTTPNNPVPEWRPVNFGWICQSPAPLWWNADGVTTFDMFWTDPIVFSYLWTDNNAPT